MQVEDNENTLAEERINALIDQHKDYKVVLGRQGKSKKWAVWLLPGALVGLSKRAQDNALRGDLIANFMLFRTTVEYFQQIEFFINPRIKNQAVLDWWRSYNPLIPNYSNDLRVIEYRLFNTRDGKKLKKYIKGYIGKDDDIHSDRKPMHKQVLDMSSLYVHPSFNLTNSLFMSDKNNGSYSMYEFSRPNPVLAWKTADIIIDLAEEAMHLTEEFYNLDLEKKSDLM